MLPSYSHQTATSHGSIHPIPSQPIPPHAVPPHPTPTPLTWGTRCRLPARGPRWLFGGGFQCCWRQQQRTRGRRAAGGTATRGPIPIAAPWLRGYLGTGHCCCRAHICPAQPPRCACSSTFLWGRGAGGSHGGPGAQCSPRPSRAWSPTAQAEGRRAPGGVRGAALTRCPTAPPEAFGAVGCRRSGGAQLAGQQLAAFCKAKGGVGSGPGPTPTSEWEGPEAPPGAEQSPIGRTSLTPNHPVAHGAQPTAVGRGSFGGCCGAAPSQCPSAPPPPHRCESLLCHQLTPYPPHALIIN